MACAALFAACGDGESSQDDASGSAETPGQGPSGEPGSTTAGSNGLDDETPPDAPVAERTCLPSASSAPIRATGDACGVMIDYNSPALGSMHLSHRTIDPPDQITVIVAGDEAPESLPGSRIPTFFADHDTYLVLALSQGPVAGNSVGTYELLSGGFFACGVGSMIFEPGIDVTLEISDYQAQGFFDDGTARVAVSGLRVAAFSELYGEENVPTCDEGGEMSFVIDGSFTRN